MGIGIGIDFPVSASYAHASIAATMLIHSISVATPFASRGGCELLVA